jgi:hypothetical protein
MFSISGLIKSVDYFQYGNPEEEKYIVEFVIEKNKSNIIRFKSFYGSVKKVFDEELNIDDFIQVTFKVEGKEYKGRVYNDLIATKVLLLQEDRKKKKDKQQAESK